MPGLLLAMDQQPSAIASDTTKHEVSDAASSHLGQAPSVNGANGISHLRPEEAPKHDEPLVNGDEPRKLNHGTMLPALDDSWRQSAANVSFGKMLGRMGQGCCADLSELVTKLSDIPIGDGPPQINGTRVPANEDTDPASLKKKQLIMEFASTWRERFIKARIISDWARTSGKDVAKFIDLRNTLRERELRIQAAVQGILNLKLESLSLRMPEPNLRGAMQYLSIGNSSYPDLGYAKQKPLEAKEVLELTNEMGVQANLRIWLDEPELPYYMTDYTIANGRVTWRATGEFEVDLACVDQDPAKSPWYFVDLRFSFWPAPNISDDARPYLEAQINAATAAKGLQGCYDFCHSYVLDYRIAEMESQAHALLRDRWFESLRVERLRRVLTVQYWAERGGKKSWIELGVHSGKGQQPSHQPSTPVNYCRWFLDGRLVEYVDLGIDWTTLDLEKVLLDVQRRHAAPLLEGLEQGLKNKKPAADMLQMKLEMDSIDEGNSQLVLDLPSAHPARTKTVAISIAPITGKWVISPRLEQTKALEDSITKDPANLTSDALERVLCGVMQAGVELEAQKRGWLKIRRLYPETLRNFKNLFPDGYEISIWSAGATTKAWAKKWALAYSTSLHSARWWVVQLQWFDDNLGGVNAAHELAVDAKAWNKGLMHVEELGLAKFQSIVLAMQSKSKIPYREEKYKQLQFTGEGMCYFVKASDILKIEEQGTINAQPHWSIDPIRVSAGRLLRGDSRWQHEMRIAIRPGRLQHLRQYLDKHTVPGIMASQDGGLSVQFKSPFDHLLWLHARAALRSVSTLELCTRVASLMGHKCDILSLDLVAMHYGTGLTAEFHCTTEVTSLNSRIYLKPWSTNPHQRIGVHLESLLNRDDGDMSIVRTIFVLMATLPILSTIDKLEAQENAQFFQVHIRDATNYLLQYTGEPNIAFAIHGRIPTSDNQRGLKWQLERSKYGEQPSNISEAFSKALQDFWTEPGPGCQSLRTALVTTDLGIGPAIEKLHAIIKRFVVPAAPPAAINGTANTVVNSQATTQQAAGGSEAPQSDIIMLD